MTSAERRGEERREREERVCKMKLCMEVKQIRMFTNYVKMVSDSISSVNEITIRHNPSEEEVMHRTSKHMYIRAPATIHNSMYSCRTAQGQINMLYTSIVVFESKQHLASFRC